MQTNVEIVEEGIASRYHDVEVQSTSNIHIALHDGVINHFVDSIMIFADQIRMENRLVIER